MAAINTSIPKVYDWETFLTLPHKQAGDPVEILHDTGKRIHAVFERTLNPPIESGPKGIRFTKDGSSISYFDGVNGSREAIVSIRHFAQACEEIRIDITSLRRRSLSTYSNLQESQ